MNRGALNAMKRAYKTTSGLTGLMLASAIFVSTTMPALADTHRIAYSDNLKVDIEALGGANWCGPQITLYLEMGPASPLIGHVPAQIALMNKVGGLIPTQCPQALAGEFITQVMTPGANTMIGSYTGGSASGWQFSAPPSQAPAATSNSSPATPASPTAPPASPASSQAPATPSATATLQSQAPASSTPSPVAALTPPPPTFTLPAYTNYPAVLLHYLKDNPREVSDPNLITWWTAQTFPNEYGQLQYQEFKLQPLLQQGQTNLNQTLSQVGDSVVVLLQTNLEQYDFSKYQYPVNLGDGTITVNLPWGSPTSPVSSFQLNVDLDDLTAIPMSQSAASTYEAAHTNGFGNVDRNVLIALKLKLVPGAFTNQPIGNPTATATIESAAVYAAPGPFEQNIPAKETPVVIVSSDQIDALRNAREAAAAAAVKAQLLAQQSADIQTVSGYTNDEKLYNWLNDSKIQPNALISIGEARYSSITNDQPIDVTMLVKTGGGGKQNVSTSWPNHLSLNAVGGTPPFSGSSWYLVSGYLTASTKPGDLSSALAVQNSYQCTQDECAEALDPAAIVDRYGTTLSH